jgi:hypothetical protein
MGDTLCKCSRDLFAKDFLGLTDTVKVDKYFKPLKGAPAAVSD